MKFEVINAAGAAVMSTEDPECLYPANILKSMMSAGYRFRMNGKPWKPGDKPQKRQNGGESQ